VYHGSGTLLVPKKQKNKNMTMTRPDQIKTEDDWARLDKTRP
jgi:hypothetical protein